MKQKNFQQEILVFTETSFALKAFIGHDGGGKSSFPAEELEKGFWNGLLNEMLPELMPPMLGLRSEIFIWQISTGAASLLIDLADTPEVVKDSYSLNPFYFLSAPKMN